MFALFGLVVAARLLPPTADQPGLVGAQAPAFSLQGLDGKKVSLKSLRGHTVVLHFWATYWESCYADMGHLDKLHREFKNRGVIVFGVNVGAAVDRGFAREERNERDDGSVRPESPRVRAARDHRDGEAERRPAPTEAAGCIIDAALRSARTDLCGGAKRLVSLPRPA